MDNSDAQYGSFRNNLPILVAVMMGHIALSKAVSVFFKRPARGYQSLRSRSTTQNDTKIRFYFTLFFSLIFLTALYGASILKILFIALLNYVVTKYTKNSFNGILFTWVYSIGILFLNNAYQGYLFEMISPALAFLDSYKGVGLRWHITFNFSILRMISFSMDYFWALDRNDRNAVFEVRCSVMISF